MKKIILIFILGFVCGFCFYYGVVLDRYLLFPVSDYQKEPHYILTLKNVENIYQLGYFDKEYNRGNRKIDMEWLWDEKEIR